jgi:hypothetical protein
MGHLKRPWPGFRYRLGYFRTTCWGTRGWRPFNFCKVAVHFCGFKLSCLWIDYLVFVSLLCAAPVPVPDRRVGEVWLLSPSSPPADLSISWQILKSTLGIHISLITSNSDINQSIISFHQQIYETSRW